MARGPCQQTRRPAIGCQGPVVLLDKVCIHQTDKDIQRAEIERLGAFIHASDEMVVLYSDVYLLSCGRCMRWRVSWRSTRCST